MKIGNSEDFYCSNNGEKRKIIIFSDIDDSDGNSGWDIIATVATDIINTKKVDKIVHYYDSGGNSDENIITNEIVV